MSAVGASTASAAASGMSSAETCVSSTLMRCMSSLSAASPSSPCSCLRRSSSPSSSSSSESERAVVAHVERVEQIVHHVAERRWSSTSVFEPVEIAAGLVLDQRAPQIDQLLGGRRRRLAGQALAHHQRQRILDRRVGAVGDLVELAAVEAVVEHGGEILRDAVHAARADRLDARLLDRLEDRARLLAGGLQAAMDRRVVTGELAARSNRRGRARWRLPPCRSLRGGSGSRALPPIRPGRSAAKVTSSSGLRASARRQPRDRALERLGRGFLRRRFGLDVGRHVSAFAG